MSGVAAAVTSNGKGVAGVAPDARLAVAKVLDAGGEGRVEDVNHGIRWVVDHGARVVNLSLGDPNFLLQRPGHAAASGIEYAWSKGAVPVLASGNYGTGRAWAARTTATSTPWWWAPPTAPERRRLFQPDRQRQVGHGRPRRRGRPGPDNNVISTSGRRQRYASSAGTSMAAPHVSAPSPCCWPRARARRPP